MFVLVHAAMVPAVSNDVKGTFAGEKQIIAFQAGSDDEHEETVESIDMRKVVATMHEMYRVRQVIA